MLTFIYCFKFSADPVVFMSTLLWDSLTTASDPWCSLSTWDTLGTCPSLTRTASETMVASHLPLCLSLSIGHCPLVPHPLV